MPVRFTLRQLEYFVAVGELGSIVLASEKVNVSSPSISAAISQLEKEFGLALFVRKHAQGLTLTNAGRQMMQQAQTLLRDADNLSAIASQISGVVRGPLNVGCLLTFAQLVLPAVRRSFEARYPDVQVRQFELHQMDIFQRLRDAELDVALSYDLDIPADLRFVPLVALPPLVMLAADHPLAGHAALRIEDLATHEMVLLDLPHSNAYFTAFFTQAGLQPKVVERTRDMAVLRTLVANGYGYSIANTQPLTDRAPDGQPLVYVPLDGAARPLIMGLVMADGADNALTIRAFVDHCAAEITNTHVPGLRLQSG